VKYRIRQNSVSGKYISEKCVRFFWVRLSRGISKSDYNLNIDDEEIIDEARRLHCLDMTTEFNSIEDALVAIDKHKQVMLLKKSKWSVIKPSSPKMSSKKNVVCPHCYFTVSVNSEKCPQCGGLITTSEASND